MTVLVATDLDRTMIYSRAAMGPDPTATDSDMRCVEHYDGAPLSFVTETGATLLQAVARAAVLVPTTTRTIEQFRRITLPGGPWRYAITSNGGNILVDGISDPRWRSGIDEATQRAGAELDEVTAALRSRISDDWVSNCRVADQLFCYLVVDLAALPGGFLAEWGAWCAARGWNVSRQGRKIYTMPNAVSKSAAVAEVRRRLIADGSIAADSMTLAAGDGALDADMLAAADAAIRPRHGELDALDWQHPHLTVTAGRGIAAGEEILRWFLRHAETARPAGPSASTATAPRT
ncbi:HAD family hydrolase [Rhodococcus sp. TAF43]|uniref:HAD family hydrolase n=1 Tax=unclassified Rhodococcus (in: high G+C Gram-positive bacteria) TaxID=192944 RepID=UPI00158428B1|nr:HAD family hydrolase [Rhodococcus sp. W8901]QKT11004.1 HAD family hydrolase [Rhodococcus sp. W8901]